MILKYSLAQNDYFQQMLYAESKNKGLNKTDFKSHFGNFLLCGMVAYAFAQHQLYNYLAVFLIIVASDVLLYKTRSKKDLFKYLLQFSKEQDLLVQNKEVIFNFDEEAKKIEVSQFGRTLTVDLKILQSIVELEKYFYINFINNIFIIPKSEIENLQIFKDKLKEIATEYKIEIKEDLNWHW